MEPEKHKRPWTNQGAGPIQVSKINARLGKLKVLALTTKEIETMGGVDYVMRSMKLAIGGTSDVTNPTANAIIARLWDHYHGTVTRDNAKLIIRDLDAGIVEAEASVPTTRRA